ncbi:MAG: hypothetical protein MUC38_13135 [Cyclobacteriaceae bacterium]|nr:hypothetical protein [Cyclobacteriaceae bacterium]
MKPARFADLLTNYTALSKDEAEELVSVLQQCPYSQVVRTLAARGAQDFQLPGKESLLQLSAVYSTDRVVLKSVMTHQPRPRQPALTAETHTTYTEPSLVKHAVFTSAEKLNHSSGEPVAQAHPMEPVQAGIPLEQVLSDISQMHESMRKYEEVVTLLSQGKPIPAETLAPRNELTKEQPLTVKPEPEAILDEIKATKKKVKPEGYHHKEQQEIIDQFIKNQPTISRPAQPAKESTDLAASHSEFGDHIVSETLVEILLRQGKKDKAIEVLKKLIWKYPQKKAYFAAQIEDLKK